MAKYACFALLFLFSLKSSASAQVVPPSDPAALTLLQRSLAALSAGNRLDDMQLKGTATWTAGSDNLQGSVTLEANSSGRSRMTLDLGGKRRTEFFSGDNDDPACTWAGDDNTTRKVAIHNCFSPGPWFFPVLSFLPAFQRGNIIVSYVGREVENGVSLEHVRVQRVFLGKSKISGLLNHLSTVDLYLDASTMLPAAFRYFVHPDNDAEKDIPAEVRFSDYRDVRGVKIRFTSSAFSMAPRYSIFH